MIKEIDLSVQYLNRRTLKDDLSYYRNIMQHDNNKSLEMVHKYLRDTIEAKYESIKSGIKEVIELEDDEDTYCLADDLMLLAFQSEEQWENKDKLDPCIKFMIESYIIILDVLRQNSVLLSLYNSTAIHCMDFCFKNNKKNEFKRITDTLSKHLKQILETNKESNLKGIPHPVLIHENDSFEKILELRVITLQYCLRINNWSDAMKTVKDIKEIDKVRKKTGSDRVIKKGLNILQNAILLDLIAEMYSKAKCSLFYSATLCSADKKFRILRRRTDDNRRIRNEDSETSTVISDDVLSLSEYMIPSAKDYADRIILSFLTIPLDERISNYREIGFNILNEDRRDKSEDFAKFTDMIDQSADLDRSTILKYIIDKNLLTICSEEVKNIFDVMESVLLKPQELSRKSKQSIEWIEKNQFFSQFLVEVRSNLIIRILQKLGKVYKVIKFDNFKKMFGFISFAECEKIIVEGNRSYMVNTEKSHFGKALITHSSDTLFRKRERLFNIKIDPKNAKLIFDCYEENELIMQQLETFTADIRRIHSMIYRTRESDYHMSKAVFNKILENIPSEIDNIYLRLETDEGKRKRMKAQMEEQRQKDLEESKLTDEQKLLKHEREMYELERKILRENVIRDKTDYLKKKVEDLVAFLDKEGIKSVNSVPLKDIWTLNEDVESVYFSLKDIYDDINDKKQDEANSHANKALNELDLHERGSRIYEIPKLKAQLKVRNETEIADLKKYLEEKHSNDLKIKHQLSITSESMNIFLNGVMDVRRKELAAKMEEFKIEKTKEIKQNILNRAIKKFKVEDNKRKSEEAAKQRALKTAQIDSKRPADEKDTPDDKGGFTRKGFGTEKPVDQPIYNKERKNPDDKPSSGPKAYGRSDGFTRSNFGKGEVEADQKKDERKIQEPAAPKEPKGMPSFSNSKKTGAEGGVWRSGGAKADDSKKKEDKKEDKKEEKKDFKKKEENKKSDAKPKEAGGRFSKGWD